MKKTDKISTLPKLLATLQKWLWYNDKYKIFFSRHHTNNPNEFYVYFLDVGSGTRSHGKYKMITECILLEFKGTQYKVIELENMRKYDIILIQLHSYVNDDTYHNFMAEPIPEQKGKPYTIPEVK